MIDLKLIENEIEELCIRLANKKQELSEAKMNNIKEQYGENAGCNSCAYSCCMTLTDYHSTCVKGECIHCCNMCDSYTPENDLSSYIRDNHCYDDMMVSILNDLFDVRDIMKTPQLHEKALEILKLVDKTKNAYGEII